MFGSDRDAVYVDPEQAICLALVESTRHVYTTEVVVMAADVSLSHQLRSCLGPPEVATTDLEQAL